MLSSAYGQTAQTFGELGTTPDSNLSASFETSYTSNMVAQNSDEYSRSVDISAILGINNDAGRWSLVYNGSKDTLREREYSHLDGSLSWSRALGFYNNFHFSASASASLPVSDDSRNNKFLYTRLSAGPKVTVKWRDVLGMDGINLSYAPIMAKSFHQYTTSRTRVSNNEYSFIQQPSVSLFINSQLSMALVASYTRHWTYEGNTKDAFMFDQSLSWSVNNSISLAIGHNNQGNALAANGIDSGINIYDINSSTIYSTLGISLP